MPSALRIAQYNSGPDIVGGGVGLVLAAIALLIGIAWIVFPFIVIGKANEIIRLLQRIAGGPAQPPRLSSTPPRIDPKKPDPADVLRVEETLKRPPAPAPPPPDQPYRL